MWLAACIGCLWRINMSNATAIKLLKQALQIGDKTALIREAIKELEDIGPMPMLPDIETQLVDMCAREYRPKCAWCNDYLLSKHPFKDDKGEYCSVACMLTSQD
jgi:hypothetical protein